MNLACNYIAVALCWDLELIRDQLHVCPAHKWNLGNFCSFFLDLSEITISKKAYFIPYFYLNLFSHDLLTLDYEQVKEYTSKRSLSLLILPWIWIYYYGQRRSEKWTLEESWRVRLPPCPGWEAKAETAVSKGKHSVQNKRFFYKGSTHWWLQWFINIYLYISNLSCIQKNT